MKVIGIIGGIGAGKSTIVSIMNELTPIKIISADLIGHQVLRKGNKAYNPVVNTFGDIILSEDGEIDRKKLGDIVFSSEHLVEVLNKITHPIIREEIELLIEEYKLNYKEQHIILEAALLIESGLIDLTDVVIAVHAEVGKRTNRVSNRDNISLVQISARMNAQKKWDELKNHANYIIDNNNGLDCTRSQVVEILKVLKEEL